ncbi:MAG: LamB/YcsF family protein [Emticicia sp.]|nr:LamB/YcsF family protein [Emticicia sp.]
MIENTQSAINQVIMMIEKQCVISTEGKEVSLKADTICIHGDGNHAVEFAFELRKALI